MVCTRCGLLTEAALEAAAACNDASSKLNELLRHGLDTAPEPDVVEIHRQLQAASARRDLARRELRAHLARDHNS